MSRHRVGRRGSAPAALAGGSSAWAFLGLALALQVGQASSPGEGETRGPLLRLSNPTLTLAIVPGLGGRIVELRADGGETMLDSDPRFWKEPFAAPDLRTPFEPWNGHTYWVGPQTAWWTQQEMDADRRKARATWPPDPFHETARYEV